MKDKHINYRCPNCLVENKFPDKDLENNAECFSCGHIFGLVNDIDGDFGFTCLEFKEAEKIKGLPIG